MRNPWLPCRSCSPEHKVSPCVCGRFAAPPDPRLLEQTRHPDVQLSLTWTSLEELEFTVCSTWWYKSFCFKGNRPLLTMKQIYNVNPNNFIWILLRILELSEEKGRGCTALFQGLSTWLTKCACTLYTHHPHLCLKHLLWDIPTNSLLKGLFFNGLLLTQFPHALR